MARQLYQLSHVQEAFAARIRHKIQERREQCQDQADNIPLLGWLLRPLHGIAFDVQERRKQQRGEHGEHAVLSTLLRWLADSWCIFHNVVVEPQPDEFAQIDLLLVGPAGVFLIETKAWRGSYKGYRDAWQQREGQNWIKVASPTSQVQRQARLLASWFAQQRSLALPDPAASFITPLVVFTQPQWLRVSQCSVAVFEGTRPLIRFLQAQPDDALTVSQVEMICDLIIRSPTPVFASPQPEPAPRPAQSRADRPVAHEPVDRAAAVATSGPAPAGPEASSRTPPSCPNCGVTMVLRTARQGANAGNQFYGCPNFPRCRAVLPLVSPSGHCSDTESSRRQG